MTVKILISGTERSCDILLAAPAYRREKSTVLSLTQSKILKDLKRIFELGLRLCRNGFSPESLRDLIDIGAREAFR